MTKSINETSAMRLRTARDDMGYSRKVLSEKTGIPAKSIEHYEAGTTQPPLNRLKLLVDTLEVTSEYILNGKIEELPNEEIIEPETNEETNKDLMEVAQVNTILSKIDNLRKIGFVGNERKLEAFSEEFIRLSKFLSLEELIEVGKARGFKVVETLETAKDLELGLQVEIINHVLERLLDTAIVGFDLFAQDIELLKSFARTHDISPDGFGIIWASDMEVISRVRDKIREIARSDIPIFDFPEKEGFNAMDFIS